MARIRTIKPEFWTDRKIVGLSPLARLLFIGSWNFTICDDGHIVDDTFALKLQVLPMEAVDVDHLVDELLAAEVMTRGVTSDGRSYLHVPKLREHQKVDGRWVPRCYVCADQRLAETPASSPKLTETRASLGETQRDSAELTQTPPNSPWNGMEGNGTEGKGDPSPPGRAHRIPDTWDPGDVGRAYARERGFDGQRLEDMAADFRGHWLNKPGKDGRKLDWHLAWYGWVRKEAKWAAERGSNGNGHAPVVDHRKVETSEEWRARKEAREASERKRADELIARGVL